MEPGYGPSTPGTSFVPSPVSRELLTDSVSSELGRILRMSGLNSNAVAMATERFSFYSPDDYGRLETILLELGAPPTAVRSAVGLYKLRTGGLEPPDGPKAKEETDDDAALAKLKRRRWELLESRMLEAEIARMERDGQPGPQQADPELAALKAEVATLRSDLKLREVEDRHARELAGLEGRYKAELADVRRGAPPTSDSVKLAMQSKAADLAVSQAADRLHDAPRVGPTFNKLLDSPTVSKAIERTAARLLSDPADAGHTFPVPTPEEWERAMREADGRGTTEPTSTAAPVLPPSQGRLLLGGPSGTPIADPGEVH
jgi:hypothetical protein